MASKGQTVLTEIVKRVGTAEKINGAYTSLLSNPLTDRIHPPDLYALLSPFESYNSSPMHPNTTG